MSIWRRPSGTNQPSSSPIAGFINSILHKPSHSAHCRLPIAQYGEFRTTLLDRLRRRKIYTPDLTGIPGGRLVGVCPECEARLSVEYLEWLYTAALTGTSDREIWRVGRFAQGRCVHLGCRASEIVLLWQPQ